MDVKDLHQISHMAEEESLNLEYSDLHGGKFQEAHHTNKLSKMLNVPLKLKKNSKTPSQNLKSIGLLFDFCLQ
jgi:hypothetical protein